MNLLEAVDICSQSANRALRHISKEVTRTQGLGSAAEVGAGPGTRAATAIRFVAKLGYGSYADFQATPKTSNRAAAKCAVSATRCSSRLQRKPLAVSSTIRLGSTSDRTLFANRLASRFVGNAANTAAQGAPVPQFMQMLLHM